MYFVPPVKPVRPVVVVPFLGAATVTLAPPVVGAIFTSNSTKFPDGATHVTVAELIFTLENLMDVGSTRLGAENTTVLNRYLFVINVI
jgi:hypothetical protein